MWYAPTCILHSCIIFNSAFNCAISCQFPCPVFIIITCTPLDMWIVSYIVVTMFKVHVTLSSHLIIDCYLLSSVVLNYSVDIEYLVAFPITIGAGVNPITCSHPLRFLKRQSSGSPTLCSHILCSKDSHLQFTNNKLKYHPSKTFQTLSWGFSWFDQVLLATGAAERGRIPLDTNLKSVTRVSFTVVWFKTSS